MVAIFQVLKYTDSLSVVYITLSKCLVTWRQKQLQISPFPAHLIM